jgi:hypothetical protein
MIKNLQPQIMEQNIPYTDTLFLTVPYEVNKKIPYVEITSVTSYQ